MFLKVTTNTPVVRYAPSFFGTGLHDGKTYGHSMEINAGHNCLASGYLSDDFDAVLVVLFTNCDIWRRGVGEWLFRYFLLECQRRGVATLHAFFVNHRGLRLVAKVVGAESIQFVNQRLKNSAPFDRMPGFAHAVRGLEDGTVASVCVDIDLATIDIEAIRKESPFEIPA